MKELSIFIFFSKVIHSTTSAEIKKTFVISVLLRMKLILYATQFPAGSGILEV